MLSIIVLSRIQSNRFNFILDQVKGYETQLEQQKTQLEDITVKFREVQKECSRLSNEKGNLVLKVILGLFSRWKCL